MDTNTILIIVGFLGYSFVNWRKGGAQASSDVIALYKARDEVQDKQHKENKDQINFLTGEVGRLKGMLEEKDRRIATLERVDISHNPIMMAFMARMETSAKDHEIFRDSFKDTPHILSEIKTFMSKINEHMTMQV